MYRHLYKVSSDSLSSAICSNRGIVSYYDTILFHSIYSKESLHSNSYHTKILQKITKAFSLIARGLKLDFDASCNANELACIHQYFLNYPLFFKGIIDKKKEFDAVASMCPIKSSLSSFQGDAADKTFF